jgi:carboxypeptidase Taq
LGNVYAGCLAQAMRAQVAGVDEGLAQGDASAATTWLRDGLQQYGGLRRPGETVAHACGFEPTEAPLLDYLEAKFAGIYRL